MSKKLLYLLLALVMMMVCVPVAMADSRAGPKGDVVAYLMPSENENVSIAFSINLTHRDLGSGYLTQAALMLDKRISQDVTIYLTLSKMEPMIVAPRKEVPGELSQAATLADTVRISAYAVQDVNFASISHFNVDLNVHWINVSFQVPRCRSHDPTLSEPVQEVTINLSTEPLLTSITPVAAPHRQGTVNRFQLAKESRNAQYAYWRTPLYHQRE